MSQSLPFISSSVSIAGNYRVKLLDCPSLSNDDRAAAELRFRMALEFALGGPEYVLPTLQAYMLAESLKADPPDEDEDGDEDEDEDEDNEDADAENQVIALWQGAESEAVLVAMRPLGDKLDNARFEIVPLRNL